MDRGNLHYVVGDTIESMDIRFVEHSWVLLGNTRALSKDEAQLLQFLLRCEFLGVNEVKEQLSFVKIYEYCRHCPSVSFTVDRSLAPSAVDAQYVPVIAQGQDADGMFVEILLHLSEGYLSQLEMWRGDGGPIHSINGIVGLHFVQCA